MAHQKHFVDKKHGFITILHISKYVDTVMHVKCKCDCGNEFIAVLENIERKKIKSCGCLHKANSEIHKKHFHNKFMSLIKKVNDCLIWEGLHRTIKGRKFPYINHSRHQFNPVKYLYELENSKTTNKNLIFVRQCDSDLCVNPSHHVLVGRSNLQKALRKEI